MSFQLPQVKLDNEVRKRAEQVNSAMSLGFGGILLAVQLIALLTWFPAGSVGQPLWLLGCVEVIASFGFAFYGLKHLWRYIPSFMASAWGTAAPDLNFYVDYVTYHRSILRFQLLYLVFVIFTTPFHWPLRSELLGGSVKVIIVIGFFVIWLLELFRNRNLFQKYEAEFPKEIRKEDRNIARKGTIPIMSSIFFAGGMIFFNMENAYPIANDLPLKHDWTGILTLLGLVPLLIHLIYARRLARAGDDV
jgi:hypothetical protein